MLDPCVASIAAILASWFMFHCGNTVEANDGNWLMWTDLNNFVWWVLTNTHTHTNLYTSCPLPHVHSRDWISTFLFLIFRSFSLYISDQLSRLFNATYASIFILNLDLFSFQQRKWVTRCNPQSSCHWKDFVSLSLFKPVSEGSVPTYKASSSVNQTLAFSSSFSWL